MGTGVLGGGGGGGAGIRAGLGGCTSVGGVLHSQAPQRSEVDAHIRSIFSGLPKEYVLKYCKSPLMQDVYAALFQLGVELGQNRSWDGIQRRFGVDPGPGCLRRLAQAILGGAGTESDERVQGAARGALDDFLMEAVGNDPTIFVNGDADGVLKAIRPETFASTSAHFLAFLLQQILGRESGRTSENARRASREGTERLANRIVANFVKERQARGAVRYSELLQTLAEDPAWFRGALKK